MTKYTEQRRQRINCRYEQEAKQKNRVAVCVSVWNANQIPELCVRHSNCLNQGRRWMWITSVGRSIYPTLFLLYLCFFLSLPFSSDQSQNLACRMRISGVQDKALQGRIHCSVVLSELDNTARHPRKKMVKTSAALRSYTNLRDRLGTEIALFREAYNLNPSSERDTTQGFRYPPNLINRKLSQPCFPMHR